MPEPPEWLADLLLAKRFHRFPWELEEGPLEWVARLYEFQYQTVRQGVDL